MAGDSVVGVLGIEVAVKAPVLGIVVILVPGESTSTARRGKCQ